MIEALASSESIEIPTLRVYLMDERSQSTETTTKAGLTIALLLFASVILGAGALGDEGGQNSADSSDREPTDDVREDDRANDNMDLDLDRLGTACESGDEEACNRLEMMRTDRGDRGEDRTEIEVRDLSRERNPEGMHRDLRNGMGVDPEILVEMVEMWCHDHVYSTFWENSGDVHEGEEGFEIVTYDENDNMETTFISHDAMSQLLMGLEPLVESCTDMMLRQMGVPIHYDEHEDDWGEYEWCEEHPDSDDCNWMDDERDDEGESDEEDDDAPCNTPDCDGESDESQD